MNDKAKTDTKQVDFTQADRLLLTAAIHTQLKSLERAARAQQAAGRTAMADIYINEAKHLTLIRDKLA